MSFGSCACCQRRFRSMAARELAEKRAAVLADLKLSRKITYSFTPANYPIYSGSKHQRHQEASKQFRQHGAG